MPGRRPGAARGKLKAIASRWASGRGGGGAPADDAASGEAAAAIAAIEARRAGSRPDAGIEIGPDAFDAVRLFYRLHSQWRFGGLSGVRIGLDYAAIGPTAAMLGLVMTPALFDDIAVMERAALEVFAR